MFGAMTIGAALLTRWRKPETLDYLGYKMQASLRSDQPLFFIGGDGGTEKGCIIEAIAPLCASWGRSDNISENSTD